MPASVRMSSEEIWAFLAEGHTGIFTTLRSDMVPIALPVWFAVCDQLIYVSTRGKKLTRVRNDSRASFLVESGTHWAELKAVHLTGQAETVDVAPDLAARIEAEFDRKYAAYRTTRSAMPTATREAYRSAIGALVRFTPDQRILNWDNAKLGLTEESPNAGSQRG